MRRHDARGRDVTPDTVLGRLLGGRRDEGNVTP
jgi:hypothetical protein